VFSIFGAVILWWEICWWALFYFCFSFVGENKLLRSNYLMWGCLLLQFFLSSLCS